MVNNRGDGEQAAIAATSGTRGAEMVNNSDSVE